MTEDFDFAAIDGPADFTEMVDNLVYPQKPQKPYLKREAYKTNKDFHTASADAEDKYDEKLLKFRKDMEVYQEKLADINELFWKWAISDTGLERLPENVKRSAIEYGLNRGDGYYEMYHALYNVSDLILDSFKAGQESVKK